MNLTRYRQWKMMDVILVNMALISLLYHANMLIVLAFASKTACHSFCRYFTYKPKYSRY